jgi:hypothetical protein
MAITTTIKITKLVNNCPDGSAVLKKFKNKPRATGTNIGWGRIISKDILYIILYKIKKYIYN